MHRALGAAACAVALVLSGCAGGDDDPAAQPSRTATAAPTATPTPTGAPSPEPPPSAEAPAATEPPAKPPRKRHYDVLAISVDGLNPSAVGGAAFDRLFSEGVGTLNARTAVEQTVTLPNHTGMLTGRRIDAGAGGHGVTWNDEIPGRTVPGPGGDGVASVFDVVHAAGGTTALFAGKDKFATFERSWPGAIDEFEVDGDPEALVDDAIDDLTTERRRFTFLHLELPDVAGHASGWLSPAYDDAVARTDQLLGEVLAAVDSTRRLSKRLVVVLTADHGGPEGEKQHSDAGDVANYRIPFVVWGAGIEPGDLYERNPDYADPGGDQLAYDGTQPVRNADVANLALDLLGLDAVPGSELDAAQDLDVR